MTTQSVLTTGDFSQTNNCSSVLATAASCVVQVSFRPSLGGLRTGSLSVGGNNGTLSSSLTGQRRCNRRRLTRHPFGSQPIQTRSGTQTLTLTNSGNIPLQISGISIRDRSRRPTTARQLCRLQLPALFRSHSRPRALEQRVAHWLSPAMILQSRSKLSPFREPA